MTDHPIIYHNPRCSKSRKTLAFLRDEEGLEVIRYLEAPPSTGELDRICTRLGVEPTELLRVKERRFKELGLSLDDQRSREEWIEIIVDNPILLERPIVVIGDRAVVGRPPERVLELIG